MAYGPGRNILSRLTVLCRSTSCGGGTGRNSSKPLFAGSICSEVEASVNTMIGPGRGRDVLKAYYELPAIDIYREYLDGVHSPEVFVLFSCVFSS